MSDIPTPILTLRATIICPVANCHWAFSREQLDYPPGVKQEWAEHYRTAHQKTPCYWVAMNGINHIPCVKEQGHDGPHEVTPDAWQEMPF